MIKGDDVITSKLVLEFSDLENVKGIEYCDDSFIITRVRVSPDEYHNERVIIPGDDVNRRTFKKYYFSK
ncbi:MAG: hypothetical protein J6X03_03680 [Bacilli bacterium]|nr:hypothetical protein [Bacilli bacterium]